MAAWVQDVFCNFYLVKNHKIANILTTAKARENLSTNLESLKFLMYVWLNSNTIKFYLVKLETYFWWQQSYLLGVIMMAGAESLLRNAFTPKRHYSD